jgi:hypothetical protein
MTGNLLMAGVIILNIVSVFVSALFEEPFFWRTHVCLFIENIYEKQFTLSSQMCLLL